MRLRTSHPHTALYRRFSSKKVPWNSGSLGENPWGKGTITNPPHHHGIVQQLQFSGRERDCVTFFSGQMLVAPGFSTETVRRCQNVVIWLSSRIGRRKLAGLCLETGPADRRELDP